MNTSPYLLPIPESWEGPINQWIRTMRVENKSPETIRTRTQHIRTSARALNCPPDRVTEDALFTWVLSKTWERETRHGYYTSLRSFFSMLSETTAGPNPALHLPTIHRSIPPARPVPDPVLETAFSTATPRVAAMLKLAAFAGLRCHEIAQCNIADLGQDQSGYTLFVRGKGDRPRLLPIGDELAHIIRAQAAGHPGGWLFPGRIDGHLSARWVSRLGAKVLPPPWTMHKLRHRYGTTTYALSHDLVAVKNLLGHSSVATTQRYVALPLDAMRAAATYAQDLHTTTESSNT